MKERELIGGSFFFCFRFDRFQFVADFSLEAPNIIASVAGEEVVVDVSFLVFLLFFFFLFFSILNNLWMLNGRSR